ncbi:MAG: FtsX-like permease family protein [Gaiellales bacterium]
MRELFGLPASTMLVAIVVLLALAGVVVTALVARQPVLGRLAVRNLGRRRARTALIVAGLMLGTTIVAAALVTGDTMSHTIRVTAVKAVGASDEVVSARGATEDLPGELGAAVGMAYVDESVVQRVERATRASGLVDGVTGAIFEQVAVQAPRTRQSEPSVVLFAADPARMGGFSPILAGGRDVSLAALRRGELYLNSKAADKLDVRAGDGLTLYVGARPVTYRIAAVVEFDGAGTLDAAALVPLADAQRLYSKPGKVMAVLISNRGGTIAGAKLTDEVKALVDPVVTPLGLETATVKQDALDTADETGALFMAFFTTFGTFSIAAGILLIFLIFVMLAAERRGELGIARAIGTRRGHLVELFTFEGVAYALIAAAVGAILGAVVAFGMVFVLARAFATGNADEGLQIEYALRPSSLVVAFGIGMLLTLAVVAFSAWRVSVMTIAAAIRNLPEPLAARRRRRVVLAMLGLALGALLLGSGWRSGAATPLILGFSLLCAGAAPLLALARVPARLAYTASGLALVVFLLLPWRAWEALFGQLSMSFTTWIVSGLMIVVGVVWVTMFNADLLLPAAVRLFTRFSAVVPVVRISTAYPLAARFRTGTTFAMFTLVVFTLVTGTVSPASFAAAFGTTERLGGGYDIRAGTTATKPITDLARALRETPGIRAADFVATGSQSILGVDATQVGAGRAPEAYLARGLDRAFLDHTTFELGAIARGYASDRGVWNALRDNPRLAVVDSTVVPRRDSFNFAVAPDFKVTGLLYEDGVFDPIPVRLVDKQTGRSVVVTIIGVLADTAPTEMLGLSTSQETLAAAFPGRVAPTIHYLAVAPSVDPDEAAASLESAFLANGFDARSIRAVVDEVMGANRTFNRLLQGFMGLGLLVGVAALGVISARAVVERRQHIGVLRALGFRQGMVEATFLVESAVLALSSIVVGTILGLVLAYNIVADQRSQRSWAGMTMVVPWWNLVVIFGAVLAVSLLTTIAPAIRAARIPPAQALRYE